MKPVLVLQQLASDGPSYLGTWLAEHGVGMDLRCTEAGQEFPADMAQHRALAVLGGAMSANDELPGLRRAEQLIREAMARGIPVIGHCLGGQLLARALGSTIGKSPSPEVGWHPVEWQAGAVAWFGSAVTQAPTPEVFQWHFEAFDLPAGAERLAGNAACPNQAFAVGPHLAMQFHVELDAAKLAVWVNDLDADYHAALAAHPQQVQTPDAMRRAALVRLATQQRMAAVAYGRWLTSAPTA